MNHQVSICIFTVGKSVQKVIYGFWPNRWYLGTRFMCLKVDDVPRYYPYQVGGLEPWNFMTFHSVGNFIIPTDELTPSFFRGVGRNTINQIYPDIIFLKSIETSNPLRDLAISPPGWIHGFSRASEPESSQILGIVIHGFHGFRESQA